MAHLPELLHGDLRTLIKILDANQLTADELRAAVTNIATRLESLDRLVGILFENRV